MSDSTIVMYGTNWCSDCRRAKTVFNQVGTEYTYVNIEENEEAAEYVAQVNQGARRVPTIVFPDGSILVEPSNAQLQAKLTS